MAVFIVGDRAIASPSILGGRTDLPISLIAALAPAVAVQFSLNRGHDAIDRSAVRPTSLFDAALISLLVALLWAAAVVSDMPTLGRDAALLVGLGLIGRLAVNPTVGAFLPAGYVFVLFIIGRPHGTSIPVWAVPLQAAGDRPALIIALAAFLGGLILLTFPRLGPSGTYSEAGC